MFDIDYSNPKGFEPPPGRCQACDGESSWRMIKVAQQGDEWRAGYCHNVLFGYESGKPVDWGKVSMNKGLRFEGWLEFCNKCEPQPHRPTGMGVTLEDIKNHSEASPETIRRMLANAEINPLPYDKNDREVY